MPKVGACYRPAGNGTPLEFGQVVVDPERFLAEVRGSA